MKRALLLLVTAAATLGVARPAAAAPGMLVGAREDGLKWTTAETSAVARDLGLRALGITLGWQPGQIDLTPYDAGVLNRAVVGASGVRVVVAIFSGSTRSPTYAAERENYCTYVGRLITRFPQINDVVIWNEPNLAVFWGPQYTAVGSSEAPARYQELLARCYDVLHALRPSVNVIGPATSLWGNDNPNAFSNVSHSPAKFIEAMGAAYRASGRTRPLFDTFGHHPYPARSNERPWAMHADEAILSMGDIDRLLGLLRKAFGGTAQPLPEDGVPIWYLETGYQTQIDDRKLQLYTGAENWPGSLPDVAAQPGPPAKPPDDTPAPDQATQLADSIRMTYCQPYIGAVFNFLLRDQQSLEGWQSGLLWVDGSRKDSYDAFRQAVLEVNEGRVDCGNVKNAPGVTPGATGGDGQGASATPAAVRSLTKITYRGSKLVPYGFLHPRAQLTRGLARSHDGLVAKQLLFLLGRSAYVTVTDRSGTAGVMPMPPVKPGRYGIGIRFSGDSLNLASGVRFGVRVVNSAGRIQSDGSLRLGRALRGRLSARSNGRTVRGTLALNDHGVSRVVRLTALGLREDGRAAWLNGTDGRVRYLVHMERLRGRPLVRVRVWRDGVLLARAATVQAARLQITKT